MQKSFPSGHVTYMGPICHRPRINSHWQTSLSLDEEIADCGSTDAQWDARTNSAEDTASNDTSPCWCSSGADVACNGNNGEDEIEWPPAVYVCKGCNQERKDA